MIADGAFSTSSKNLHMYVAWEDPEKEVKTGVLNKEIDINTWTLHVPKGTKEKYQEANIWKDFGTILDDNTTGIKNTANSQQSTANGPYYDLHGRLIKEPMAKGLYIVNGRKFLKR